MGHYRVVFLQGVGQLFHSHSICKEAFYCNILIRICRVLAQLMALFEMSVTSIAKIIVDCLYHLT